MVIIVRAYGRPVLQLWKSGTLMFNERSLVSGYVGVACAGCSPSSSWWR